MKNDHLQTDLRPRDEHSPVVIHHPEDQRTDLERWVRRTLDRGPVVWIGLLGVIVAGLLIAGMLRNLGGPDSRTQAAWQELIESKSAADDFGVAEKFAGTPAETWALLKSANGNFNDGVEKLPTQIDAARPLLQKAQEQYQEVVEKAARDTPQARRAAFGLARTLEVRNEPEQAIAQYKKVAEAYPDSQEGRLATRSVALLQAELKKPADERFYAKLYAYKPADNPLPGAIPGLGGPGGGIDLEQFLKQPLGGSPTPSPAPALPPLSDPKPIPDAPATDAPAPAQPEPAKADAPKVEAPASPAPEPKSPQG